MMLWGVLKGIGLGGGLAIALAMVAGLSWYKWGAWKKDSREWQAAHKEEKKARLAWQDAFDEQKRKYRAAQEAAKRKALADKQRDIRNYQILAERNDRADQELARYRARAEQYARANRVLNRQGAGAVGGNASGANRSGAAGAASGDNRSGRDSDVVISRTDFDTLVDNTARLKVAHDWGNDLLAAGLAVKLGEEQ